MAAYKFVALGPTGEKVKGLAKGFSSDAVTADLLDQGLQEVRVKKARDLKNLELTPQKVKPVALMHLSRQLASFVRAGVPIIEALMIVQEEVKDKKLKQVLTGVAESLRRGDTLVEAVSQYEKAFPAFYVGVLRSAELTGRLDDVLDQLSLYLERDVEAKRKIRGALAYPIMILILSFVTVGVLTFFVLPRFQDFFEEFDAELPLATRLLLGFTGIVGEYGTWALLFMFVSGVGIGLGLLTYKGKKIKDQVMLKIPLIREIVRYAVIERFCRLLSSMVQAGIPLPEGMIIATEGAHNKVYEEKLAAVRLEMIQGEGLAAPIGRTQMFPTAATQMIRVGEETGTLETQLDVTARYFEQELAYKIKNLTTLFEPAVIVFMGLIVGFVAIALVSAIYGIYSQVEL
ncbi:MAG: type II secretion system F family protein [Acidimicrobiales bacterium]